MTRNTPSLSTTQRTTASRLVLALARGGTYDSVGLGAGALWASSLVFGTVGAGLPDT